MGPGQTPRRSERGIEIPVRELTDEEKHARTVEGTAATDIFMGPGPN